MQFCKKILEIGDSIIFAGAATLDGDILAAEYQDGFVSSLTTEEAELDIMQSLIRTNMRKVLEPKFGRVVYSFVEYEKIKQATFVLPEQQEYEGGGFILKVSIEKEADHNTIIENKIKPLLDEIGRNPFKR